MQQIKFTHDNPPLHERLCSYKAFAPLQKRSPYKKGVICVRVCACGVHAWVVRVCVRACVRAYPVLIWIIGNPAARCRFSKVGAPYFTFWIRENVS